jgi:exosortase/archaeosortase family protein
MDHSIAAQSAITRPILFFWLFLIAVGNKMAGMAIDAMSSEGWIRAGFNLFEISAILWVALAAGLILTREGSPEPARRSDIMLAVLVVAAAILPIYAASAAALTVTALYAIVTSGPGAALRRSGIIFLAMTGSLIWGPLLLGFFNGPILGTDAFFVSHLAGARQVGNQISFADGSGTFVIAPACSSFHGMSLALVFWATVNQWFKVRFSWISLLWAAAALGATIAVNVLRIVAIARFPGQFDALHTGWGAQVATWSTLVLVVAICLYGARRDVFAPA